ncbi:MAG: head-tail connector protein [Pseudomonadota bacterium]|nr:head-tail connector protein [Pseudomonadota bacterium]
MMVKLVSLDTVKLALRIGEIEETSGGWDVLPHEDDTLLDAYIEAASAAVINYLKDQAEVILNLDSGGDVPSGTEIPKEIETATILLVGHFYREPDGDTEEAFDRGYLPKPVTALLYPLRDPALR